MSIIQVLLQYSSGRIRQRTVIGVDFLKRLKHTQAVQNTDVCRQASR